MSQRAIGFTRREWSTDTIDRAVAETFFGVKSEQDNNLQFVPDMLTRHAPDQAAVLTTYRAIRRARRPIPDEEQSLVKSHLKLSGVVRREDSGLRVRNQIYRTSFDERWIHEHLPPAYWTAQVQRIARLAGALSILSLVLAGLAVFAIVNANAADQERTRADNNRGTAEARRQEAEAAREVAETRRIEAETAQSIAETSRLRFTIVVSPEQCNNNDRVGMDPYVHPPRMATDSPVRDNEIHDCVIV